MTVLLAGNPAGNTRRGDGAVTHRPRVRCRDFCGHKTKTTFWGERERERETKRGRDRKRESERDRKRKKRGNVSEGETTASAPFSLRKKNYISPPRRTQLRNNLHDGVYKCEMRRNNMYETYL